MTSSSRIIEASWSGGIWMTRLTMFLCMPFAASSMVVQANAQDGREALGQAAEQAGRYADALTHYVAALEATTPGSEAEYRVLERAAALAPNLRPTPPLPDEAERRFIRGQAIVKAAKDTEAFSRAADEFRLAVRAAPWLADAYFNLGVVLDKAERYAEAIRALKLYVLAAPSPKDAKDAQRFVYEIEVRQEDKQRAASKASAEAAAKAQHQAAFARGLAGDWVNYVSNMRNQPVNRYRYRLSVTGNQFEMVRTGNDYRTGRGWQSVPYVVEFRGTVDGSNLSGTYRWEETVDRTVSGRGSGSFNRGSFSGTVNSAGTEIELNLSGQIPQKLIFDRSP